MSGILYAFVRNENNRIIIQRSKFNIFPATTIPFEARHRIVKGIKCARNFVAGRRNEFRRSQMPREIC